MNKTNIKIIDNIAIEPEMLEELRAKERERERGWEERGAGASERKRPGEINEPTTSQKEKDGAETGGVSEREGKRKSERENVRVTERERNRVRAREAMRCSEEYYYWDQTRT